MIEKPHFNEKFNYAIYLFIIRNTNRSKTYKQYTYDIFKKMKRIIEK